ncbi:MAG TPA: dockerin type I domain-containing protein, partial [Anaerolineae bacterium]|nr:dockerin type I domain-containing protein [Anaerolineae bacterium]
NICPGISTTDSREFRVISLGVDRLVLNQGIPSYELITQRPTLLEHFLTRSADPRPGDKLALDSLDLEITDLQTNYTSYKTIPLSGGVPPSTLGAPSAAQLLDTVNSVNAANVFLNTASSGGTVQIKSILKNHGYIVAQNTTTTKLAANAPVRVLFVPIMHAGFTSSDLDKMKANVTQDIGPLTYRLMPQGLVQYYWSDEVRVSGSVDIGSVLKLYEAGHDMDRIRKNWNKTHSSAQVVVAFGVVEGQIASGNKDGLAFWPDLSSILNHTALLPFKALCGLANTVVKIFSFGLAGDVCNVDIPLFVGWARGDRVNSSALFGHELGHISELVKPGAINGSWDDNFSHSINDEISNGECQSTGNTFDWSKSLYAQPGVSDPVVDPISGKQYYPQNDGKVSTDRGKAIMSYACAKTSRNVFFEPADYNKVRAPIDVYFKQGGSQQLAQQLLATASSRAAAPTTTTVPGPRLFVSGVITQSNNTANFVSVERPDGEPPLSPEFVTGYDLVQRSITGTELSRLGVYPLFTSTDDQGLAIGAPTTTTNDLGFFSATVLRATGVVTIELQHDGVVLTRFHAGNAVPTINLSSPTAGTYNSIVPVTWSAADADGDPLNISLEYSRDGSSWSPVGSGVGGSGTISVPTFLLGGSATARVRAFASDGFNVGVFTSTQFTVPNQPPQPSITQPQSGATFLEGQTLDLGGGALDKQAGVITGTQLIWRSSRDGLLGTGADLPVILSVGVHTITLQATNNASLSATTSITVVVQGSYALDGIPDAQKLSGGMNPLDDKLAYSDADHDGLPLIMELKRGTNPHNADSDGDGYTDAQEIVAGTDPNSASSNPGTQPPDRLIVGPTVITFTADLTDAVPFPQQAVVIASHHPVSWTMSSTVPWLTTSSAGGQTPQGVTIEALPYSLSDGNYTGVINFSSPQLGPTVAVTVNLTVLNAARNCDVNRDGVSNATDVQLVTTAIGTDYTQQNFNLRYDLNRDGAVTQGDVTLTQACVAGIPGGHQIYLPLIRR